MSSTSFVVIVGTAKSDSLSCDNIQLHLFIIKYIRLILLKKSFKPLQELLNYNVRFPFFSHSLSLFSILFFFFLSLGVPFNHNKFSRLV